MSRKKMAEKILCFLNHFYAKKSLNWNMFAIFNPHIFCSIFAIKNGNCKFAKIFYPSQGLSTGIVLRRGHHQEILHVQYFLSYLTVSVIVFIILTISFYLWTARLTSRDRLMIQDQEFSFSFFTEVQHPWSSPESSRFLHNHPDSSRILQNPPDSSRIIQIPPESSRCLQNHPYVSRVIQMSPESSKNLCKMPYGLKNNSHMFSHWCI